MERRPTRPAPSSMSTAAPRASVPALALRVMALAAIAASGACTPDTTRVAAQLSRPFALSDAELAALGPITARLRISNTLSGEVVFSAEVGANADGTFTIEFSGLEPGNDRLDCDFVAQGVIIATVTQDISLAVGGNNDIVISASPTFPDADLDLFTNLEECIAGTDPFSAASRPADTTPPEFAGLASATALGPDKVRLVWSPASDQHSRDGIIVYSVYGAASAEELDYTVPTAEIPGATYIDLSSIVDSGGATVPLSPATDYYFAVRATDPVGNQEENEAVLMVTTAPLVVNTPPLISFDPDRTLFVVREGEDLKVRMCSSDAQDEAAEIQTVAKLLPKNAAFGDVDCGALESCDGDVCTETTACPAGTLARCLVFRPDFTQGGDAVGASIPYLIEFHARDSQGAETVRFIQVNVAHTNILPQVGLWRPLEDPPCQPLPRTIELTAGTHAEIDICAADADGDAVSLTVLPAVPYLQLDRPRAESLPGRPLLATLRYRPPLTATGEHAMVLRATQVNDPLQTAPYPLTLRVVARPALTVDAGPVLASFDGALLKVVEADANNDDVNDLIIVSKDPAGPGVWVRVLAGTHTGDFGGGTAQGPFAPSHAADSFVVAMEGLAADVAVGDVNADGYADLAMGIQTSDESRRRSVFVLRGRADGTFAPYETDALANCSEFLAQSYPHLTLVDVDGDGRDDLIANTGSTDWAGWACIFGNAPGADLDLPTFGATPPALQPMLTEAVIAATGDFNRDGAPDLVTVPNRMGMGATYGVQLGDGTGFGAPLPLPVDEPAVRSLPAVGDIDGDGFDDLVVLGGTKSNTALTIFYGGVSLSGTSPQFESKTVRTARSLRALQRDGDAFNYAGVFLHSGSGAGTTEVGVVIAEHAEASPSDLWSAILSLSQDVPTSEPAVAFAPMWSLPNLSLLPASFVRQSHVASGEEMRLIGVMPVHTASGSYLLGSYAQAQGVERGLVRLFRQRPLVPALRRFTAEAQMLAAEDVTEILRPVLADLDGDGRLDLARVLASASGAGTELRGYLHRTGVSSCVRSGQLMFATASYCADLAFDDHVSVSLVADPARAASWLPPFTIGDVNGDGAPDLIYGFLHNDTLTPSVSLEVATQAINVSDWAPSGAYERGPSNTLLTVSLDMSSGGAAFSASVGSVDGDPYGDLLLVRPVLDRRFQIAGARNVMQQTTFFDQFAIPPLRDPVRVDVSVPERMALPWADVDGDGLVETVLGPDDSHGNSSNKTYAKELRAEAQDDVGTGNYTLNTSFRPGFSESGIYGFDLGDLTGDGRGDAVFAFEVMEPGQPSTGAQRLVFYAGTPNGLGVATPSTLDLATDGLAALDTPAGSQWCAPAAPLQPRVADADGDGRTDLILVATRAFVDAGAACSDPWHYAVAMGILPGGGDIDVRLAAGGVTWLAAAGEEATHCSPGSRPYPLVGDIDADGRLDILFTCKTAPDFATPWAINIYHGSE